MRAIDMHVHVPRQPGLPDMVVEDSLRRYFRLRDAPKLGGELAARYREWDILGVVFSVDAQTATGDRPDTNDYVAGIVRDHPEQFIGFATVDPWKDRWAVNELERAATELGLRGLKLHPIHQAFFPDDRRFYPLYEKCVELDIPLLLHSGFAAAGAGTPGGGGMKLKYAAPIPHMDDIAADFPDLTIIMAHPAWPWVEEQIAVALHKPNIYIDLSGWAPRYIPEALIREANTRLQDKILFGSDFPYLPPDRWLAGFENLDIREEVRTKILIENAKRALKLDGVGQGASPLEIRERSEQREPPVNGIRPSFPRGCGMKGLDAPLISRSSPIAPIPPFYPDRLSNTSRHLSNPPRPMPSR